VRAFVLFFFFFFSPPTELSLTTTLGAFGYGECSNCENAVPMEIQQLSPLVLFENSYCCWLCFSLLAIILVLSNQKNCQNFSWKILFPSLKFDHLASFLENFGMQGGNKSVSYHI
jgi:hypothetical protein